MGLLQRGWTLRAPHQWWKEDAPGKGLRKLDPPRILVCRILALPMDEFKNYTNRGSGNGWIADLEIFWVDRQKDVREFVFHNETRYDSEQEADAACERLKLWVDRRSMQSLSQIPRSGHLSMSKMPKETKGNSSVWSVLWNLVNG